MKEEGDQNFDVTIGSFGRAEMYELVGLYIFDTLAEKYGRNDITFVQR